MRTKRVLIGIMALAGSLGLLAGCNTMSNMMGGGHTQSVSLTGANEVPAVSTSASGTGSVTVGSDRSVSAKITVSGMNATAAHIHEGAAGSNGGVIVPLTKQGNDFVAPAGAKFTEAQYDAYKAGRTYVNVHSAAHPGGEIRAQLKGN